jgi:hypothetical protein
MRALFLVVMCALPPSVSAECVRYEPLPEGKPLGFDGPGSWGELQDTVTLDCLSYVGSIERNGEEYVLIEDEQGKVHELRNGDYMGENTGFIVEIGADVIYVLQLVKRNDDWRPLLVRFPK